MKMFEDYKMLIKMSLIAVLAGASLHFWGKLEVFIKVMMCAGATFAGIIFAFKSVLSQRVRDQSQLKLNLENSVLQQMLTEKLTEYKKYQKKKSHKYPLLMSRNVDNVISEILDFIIRDFIVPWYNLLVPDSQITTLLKEEMWLVLVNARDRLNKIDYVKFFTTDIVMKILQHFQKLRYATSPPTPDRVSFYLSSNLATKKNEQEYIRRVTEFLLILLLPSRYSRCQPVRHLLREIISCLVFYNLIDTICDPDYINLKLIGYLQWQQKEMEHHNRTYSYAETFEDFVHIIQDCGNIEDLKRIRYCIVREIIHATAINNFKKAKGIELDKEFNPQTKAKGDLLQARNLKRYINQLQYAKSLCEKNIKSLGGTNYTSHKESGLLPTDVSPISGKVLSHSVIMETAYCRQYFTKYLEKEESYSLIGFWEAVEEMKHSDKKMWHQLGNEIVQLYINNPNSSVKLSKNILKGIESFIMANKGPEAFFQAQDDVYKLLEERFYPSFIVSEIYETMITEAERTGIDFTQTSQTNISKLYESELPLDNSQHEDLLEETSAMSLSEHSDLLKSQLEQLDEKISVKKQALHAIHNTQKSDIKMMSVLEKEIEDMKKERYYLESHIMMTSIWMENLGYWRASVEKVEKENEKTLLQCTIVVHLGSDPGIIENDFTEGWKVVKNISEFHVLQQKLSLVVPSIKKIDLPSQNKPRFKSYDQQYLNRAKVLLQNFLTVIMKNDTMNKSETLYNFLSPSPDHLKYPLEPRKKSIKFFLMQLFKSTQSSGQCEGSDDDELLFLDEIDSKEDKKDSIAENLYTLIGEIFEVKGIFSWVRKTLIAIVQITFGKTINRQLRETVAWITSESIVLYCLQMFRDSMWPDKKLSHPTIMRTEKEKLKTREMAKQQLLNNIPDFLGNVLGQQNAKKGMTKVFEALQDKRLNKQLFYDILEAFLQEFAPELN